MPSAISDAEYLTSEEVIQKLLAEPLLRKRAATCVLPAVRVGAEWRFRRTDLDAWIRTQLVSPQALAN